MTRTRGPIRQDAIPRTGGGTLESRLRPCRPILVVEDERDIAIFVRAYFRATGQEVVHVDPTSPAQVVESVREHHPACVLLDLNLRGFHGREVHREIRKDPDNEAVPVVVVTADHSPKTRQEAQAAGAAAFVTKPFSVKDLCQLVTDLVNGAKAGEQAGWVDGQDELQGQLAKAVEAGRRRRQPLSFALVRADNADDVASQLRASLPEAAVVGRTAEHELGVIVAGVEAAALARAVDAVTGDGLRAGVAACPEHAGTSDELYMAADAALAGATDGDSRVAVAI